MSHRPPRCQPVADLSDGQPARSTQRLHPALEDQPIGVKHWQALLLRQLDQAASTLLGHPGFQAEGMEATTGEGQGDGLGQRMGQLLGLGERLLAARQRLIGAAYVAQRQGQQAQAAHPQVAVGPGQKMCVL